MAGRRPALLKAVHGKRKTPIRRLAIPGKAGVAPSIPLDLLILRYILVGLLKDPMNRRAGVATRRNPQRTRERLLQAAFQEIHKSGFRGTDLETILTAAGVTKGAMYHHFASKEALGYAVVDEIIASMTREKWLWPLKNAKNPIDALIGIIQSTSLRPADLRCGCPLNNLAQEMSGLDEGFRTRTATIFGDWQSTIATALRNGRQRKMVRSDVDPGEAAAFLLATYEGYISLAKSFQDVARLQAGEKAMISYLESLRAPQSRIRRVRPS
jgi:TetR/AcrR family transcriptional repressor of nem operon